MRQYHDTRLTRQRAGCGITHGSDWHRAIKRRKTRIDARGRQTRHKIACCRFIGDMQEHARPALRGRDDMRGKVHRITIAFTHTRPARFPRGISGRLPHTPDPRHSLADTGEIPHAIGTGKHKVCNSGQIKLGAERLKRQGRRQDGLMTRTL